MDIIGSIMAANQARAYTDSKQLAKKELAVIDVLPKTTIEFFEMDNISIGMAEAIEPDTECVYLITWQGEIYRCSPNVLNNADESGLFVGNLALYGGEDTGEPFLILPASGETIFISTDLQPKDVEIKKEKMVITQIPTEYLPLPTYEVLDIREIFFDSGYYSEINNELMTNDTSIAEFMFPNESDVFKKVIDIIKKKPEILYVKVHDKIVGVANYHISDTDLFECGVYYNLYNHDPQYICYSKYIRMYNAGASNNFLIVQIKTESVLKN